MRTHECTQLLQHFGIEYLFFDLALPPDRRVLQEKETFSGGLKRFALGARNWLGNTCCNIDGCRNGHTVWTAVQCKRTNPDKHSGFR